MDNLTDINMMNMNMNMNLNNRNNMINIFNNANNMMNNNMNNINNIMNNNINNNMMNLNHLSENLLPNNGSFQSNFNKYIYENNINNNNENNFQNNNSFYQNNINENKIQNNSNININNNPNINNINSEDSNLNFTAKLLKKGNIIDNIKIRIPHSEINQKAENFTDPEIRQIKEICSTQFNFTKPDDSKNDNKISQKLKFKLGGEWFVLICEITNEKNIEDFDFKFTNIKRRNILIFTENFAEKKFRFYICKIRN